MADKGANSTNDIKTPGGGPPGQFQFAQKPDVKPGWEGFKQFLWNTETSEFLGRTGSSWLKIGLFYLVYYIFLTGYFLAMLFIFYQTLDDNKPKWTVKDSIIGGNPGLGFRPMPDEEDRVESTLIWYTHGDNFTGTYMPWVTRLDKHLDKYKKLHEKQTPDAGSGVVPCEPGQDQPDGDICMMDVKNLFTGSCTVDKHYGFKGGDPCVLLKLNRIYDWEPEPYKNSSELPADAPPKLKAYLEKMEKEDPKDPRIGTSVWMWCEGENPADKENIGEIEYLPYAGIPSYHFPYQKQKDYLSPVVFAHVLNPNEGVLIAISCRAYAKNIEHNQMERMGLVHFELMID